MAYLKGIPSNISSDLLKALADMGHGDLVVIADHFYPPYSKTPNGVMIDAKGNSAAEIIDSGKALETLKKFVEVSNRPEAE